MSMAPGTVTLMGSGETSASGGQVFEAIARALPAPLKISILETPAGFETNAQRVAGRVAEFLKARLQNQHPKVHLIAARKKGTPHSPDSPEIVRPLYDSQMIFFGPGSPTYTVRQLSGSLAWQVIQARQRLGAILVLASAATISAGVLALPVYEIFKVGEDPHWKPGLDFFAPYGLALVIIPHWNNREGGDDVDTSHCFIGQERFDLLVAQLPENATILGLDEHTSLTIALDGQPGQVRGAGAVHVIRAGVQQDYPAGSTIPVQALGDFHPLPNLGDGLPAKVWEHALAAEQKLESQRQNREPKNAMVPLEVQKLVEARQEARATRDWAKADQIRGRLASLGWAVKDTPGGPQLEHVE